MSGDGEPESVGSEDLEAQGRNWSWIGIKNRRWDIAKWGTTTFLGIVAFGLLFAVISAIVDKPIDDAWQNSKTKPFVAVIMAQDERDFSIPLELWNGIDEVGQTLDGRFGEVGIKLFKPRRTKEDAGQWAVRECLMIEECVAIVGGADSSTTAKILDEIVAHDGDKPALIAPIATATEISKNAAERGFSAFLRMVPSNRNQAQRISSFIASRTPAQRVMLIKDNENLDYVDDLSDLLKFYITESGGDVSPVEYRDELSIQGIPKAAFEGTDYIVFVGTAENGKAVMDSFKRNGISVPTIFTDGNTTADALENSIGMPGDVFFLTPVRSVEDPSEPGYTAIGRDTHALLRAIVNGADRPTRAAIARYVSERKSRLSISRGAAGSYAFGPDGENTEMSFQIYRAVNGSLDREFAF